MEEALDLDPRLRSRYPVHFRNREPQERWGLGSGPWEDWGFWGLGLGFKGLGPGFGLKGDSQALSDLQKPFSPELPKRKQKPLGACPNLGVSEN